eukprot:s7_g57.t1
MKYRNTYLSSTLSLSSLSFLRFWHVDNAASGVTLIVPLTPVPEDMGATLLLPGSHQLFGQDPCPKKC